MLDQYERRHGLEHGDLHLLARTGPLAMEKRHDGGIQRCQAGHLVGHDGADIAWRTGQLLLHERQATFGLDGVVVGGEIRIRSAAAVTVAIGVDDRRIQRGDRGVVEAEISDRLGAHRMDENICGAD